eukprot:Awhi_evm1s11248
MITLQLTTQKQLQFFQRCFNPDDIKRGLSQTPTYEEKRAQSIIPFVQEADLLIDLHATNKPSDAFTRIG